MSVFTLFLLVGCSKDELEHIDNDAQPVGTQDAVVEHVPTASLGTASELAAQLLQPATAARGTSENTPQYQIDPAAVSYVHTDSIATSYTIPIKKTGHTGFEFSNLVMAVDSTGIIQAYIMDYRPTQAFMNAYELDNRTYFEGDATYRPFEKHTLLQTGFASRGGCTAEVTLRMCNNTEEDENVYHMATSRCQNPSAIVVMTFTVSVSCTGPTDFTWPDRSIMPEVEQGGGGGSSTAPTPGDTCRESGAMGDVGIFNNGVCTLGGEELSNGTMVFIEELEEELKTWINHEDQEELREEIDAFLKEEGFSEEAKEFAREAIKAVKDGGEVDFENKSIYDVTVPVCLKDIVDRFKPQHFDGLNTGNFDLALKQQLNVATTTLSLFDNIGGYGFKFTSTPGTPISNGNVPNGTTTASFSNVNGSSRLSMITINIDSGYIIAATDLGIARTVIHELVHAYLFYTVDSDPNSSLSQKLDLAISDANNNASAGQHNLMSDQFVGAIAIALEAWHNNPRTNPDVYDNMAWSGAMMLSAAFGSKLQDFQEQIEQRNAAEEGRLPMNPNIAPVAVIGMNTCQ
ncbi:MAG: hypothetical protein WBA16_10475 [Nonlabens sp.]